MLVMFWVMLMLKGLRKVVVKFICELMKGMVMLVSEFSCRVSVSGMKIRMKGMVFLVMLKFVLLSENSVMKLGMMVVCIKVEWL